MALPIISHHTYLADVWLPNEAAKLAERGRGLITKRLAEFDAKIEFRHIDNWAKGSAANIEHQLTEYLGRRNITELTAKKTSAIISVWQAIQVLTQLSTAQKPTQTEQLTSLLDQFFIHKTAIESGDSIEARRASIQAALTSTQDRLDTWLIRELIGLDADMVVGRNFGFVVPLRAISLLAIDRIETERRKWYNEKDLYLRICRLRGLYKSDLVQQFANLFVRVGLEDYRNEEHKRLFQRCANDLFPGGT